MNHVNVDHSEDDLPFRLAPTCDVPAEVEARLRKRIAGFRQRVVEGRRQSWRATLPLVAHPLRCAAALTAVAAAVVVMAIWLGARSDAWADVVQAAESLPWIHAQGKHAGRTVEFWISAPRGIWAVRFDNADFVAFANRETKTTQRYRSSDRSLVQLPMEADDEEQLHQIGALFARLFRGEAEVDLSTSRETLVKQSTSEVEVGGKQWLDFQLTFQAAQGNRQRVMTYRVDPVTRLPQSCVEMPHFADDPEDRIDFDYPQSGPADIYALGVPRDAKVADHVPSPQLTEILAGMRAGREKMDAYSGLIVQRGRSHWSQAAVVWRVWRSGNKWRIEQSGPDLPGRWKVGQPRPQLPSDDTDRLAWWRAAAEKIQFYPVLVSDGQTSYRFAVKTNPERIAAGQDWSQVRFEVESVEPDYMPTPIASVGPSAGLLPEQVAWPPLGIPSEGREVTVEPHPTKGPRGTILISIRDEHSQWPGQRDWIDPHRGFMATRHELHFGLDSQGTPQSQVTVIAEAAQSPGGVWYPTVTHSLPVSREMGEDISGTWTGIINYYLDFTSPIPPEMFATPQLKPNSKHEATPPRSQAQENQRAVSGSHLSKIATAMIAFESEHKHFPSASIVGPDGKTPHSWRVALLPYLGHKALFDQYQLSEPWDSPSNLKVLAQMPEIYRALPESKETHSAYFLLVGEATLFPPGKTLGLQNIADSAGNTLLAVEARRDIPWTKPEDIAYDPTQPLPALGGFDPDGYCVVFADSTSLFIEPKSIDAAAIRAWITPAGGENVDRPH